MTDFEEKAKEIVEKIDHPSSSGHFAFRKTTKSRIELSNITIATPEKEIKIIGQVTIMSVEELVRIIKTRYRTQGSHNYFPQIVDDCLNGKKPSLSDLDALGWEGAKKDLLFLSKIFRKGKGIAVLGKIDPYIVPIKNYTINGKPLFNVVLREIDVPVIITGVGDPSSVVTFPLKDVIATKFEIVVVGTENNIVTTPRGKNYSKYADLLSIASIVFLGLGLMFMLARRGRFWELGLPMTLFGGFILYLRFFSDWGKEKFSIPPVEIEGNSMLVMDVYGGER